MLKGTYCFRDTSLTGSTYMRGFCGFRVCQVYDEETLPHSIGMVDMHDDACCAVENLASC